MKTDNLQADAMTRATQIALRELKQLARDTAPENEIFESVTGARRLRTTSEAIHGYSKRRQLKLRRGKRVVDFERRKPPISGRD